jgi:amino acid adenylation domain-containing protein/thioester reductase-like protein
MFSAATNLAVHQLFELQVLENPDAIAVKFQDRHLSYRELNHRANQLAQALKKLGVGPEVLVGVCIERSPEVIVAFLAVLKAGGAYIPLDPVYPTERLAFMIEDSQMSVLLSQQSFLNVFPQQSLPVICLDADWSEVAQESGENPDSGVTPDNLAYVIYTSGSTGTPKGVMVEHRALSNFVQAAVREYKINSSDRILQFASISFDASVEEIYPCLISGGTVVLRTEDMPYSIPRFLQKCREESMTVLDLPTAFWHLLAVELSAIPELTLPKTVRLVIIGGETANPERVAGWQRKFGGYPQLVNTYGPAEATVVATAYKLQPPAPEGRDKDGPPIVPIGRPLTNVETYILDENCQPVAPGVAGELYIGGSSLARGYLNRPELTGRKFIAHPLITGSGERLYKTGDLARYLPDGNLEFLGRIDAQVKVRGFRVEPTEIEAAIALYPDVRETAVIVHEEKLGDKQLVAYIVSNLVPERIPHSIDCLVEVDGTIIKLSTEDISKNGTCLVGVPAHWEHGKQIRLCLTLPGEQQERWLSGTVTWLQVPRAGIEFQLTPLEQQALRRSMEYLLESQGLLKTLQRSVTKNLRNYLEKKLPGYMIPHRFILLPSLSLTANGKVDREKLSLYLQGHPQSRSGIVLPQTETEAAIAELWSEILGVEVGIEDNFFDLGGSSLSVSQMLTELETRFSLALPVSYFFESPTVAAVAKAVEQLRQGQGVLLEKTSKALQVDAILDPNICMPQLTEAGSSFLTGATGFVGVNLLSQLLEQTSGSIYCLVRAANPTAGQKRLQEELRSHQLWQETFASRIVPVVGDLSKPLLGLEERQFDELANRVETIYHCGALVNFVYPYSALKTTNVLGTQEVLRLAFKNPIKPVHHISTLSVFDSPSYFDGRTIEEQDSPQDSRGLFSGYAQSKWVAEQLVVAARERGLPVYIYRMAEISGHSRTGVWNLEGYIPKLIKGCLQLGAWPDLDMVFNLTPVDYAAQAIVYLSQKPSSQAKVFHILNPQLVHWHEIFSWFQSFGYPSEWIPYEQWRARLVGAFRQSQDNALFPLSHFFRDAVTADPPLSIQELYVRSRAPAYSCQNSLSELAGSSILCPQVDAKLFRTYCSHFSREGFLERRFSNHKTLAKVSRGAGSREQGAGER